MPRSDSKAAVQSGRSVVSASGLRRVGDALRIDYSVWDEVVVPVDASVYSEVGRAVRAEVGDEVLSSVRDAVSAAVWDSVRAAVWSSVRAAVWASVDASVCAEVRERGPGKMLLPPKQPVE
jgi:hypothetical protein